MISSAGYPDWTAGHKVKRVNPLQRVARNPTAYRWLVLRGRASPKPSNPYSGSPVLGESVFWTLPACPTCRSLPRAAKQVLPGRRRSSTCPTGMGWLWLAPTGVGSATRHGRRILKRQNASSFAGAAIVSSRRYGCSPEWNATRRGPLCWRTGRTFRSPKIAPKGASSDYSFSRRPHDVRFD